MPFLFQRVDLPGARTGGLPPIGGSPSRGARIFKKKGEQISNEYLLAKFGFDTAENEPLSVFQKLLFKLAKS